MKRTYLFMNYRVVYLLVGVLIFSVSASAAESRRRSREYGRTETDSRKEQMQQEAQAMAPVIQKALTDLLEPVQKNQRPSQDLVQGAQFVLDNAKRYYSVFDDKTKGQFMLLQAWASFCQGDAPMALNWSRRACKTDEASQDAWISQAVFCLLNGRPPLLPRIEEKRQQPERQINRRRRYSDTAANETKPQPYSEKGILEFNLLGSDIRMYHEQFEGMEFQTVSGEKIEYKPGTDTLCILFYEDIPNLSVNVDNVDANDLQQQLPNEIPEEMQQAMQDAMLQMQDMMQKTVEEAVQQGISEMSADMGPAFDNLYNSQSTGIDSQRSYFKVLMEACKEKPEIEFVQINTFKPTRSESLDVLPSGQQRPIPLVFAAAPQSNAQRFVGWDAVMPFMVIIGKEGNVRYAGTAADFVPAFILTELTGVPIDLEKQRQQQTIPGQMDVTGMDPMMVDPMMMEMMMARPQKTLPETPKPQADPNKPAVDPNTLPGKTAPSLRSSNPAGEPEYKELPIEQDVQAQKEMVYARDLFIKAARKHVISYKNGVKLCREIIRKYPGTKYEDEARMLLRQVPEDKRRLYDISDEELRLP